MTAALLHATHETHTFWEFVWENTQHAFWDTIPLLPWLLLIYVVLQLLENKTNLAGSNRLGGNLGPVIGSATGLIPQCGFSVLAAKLYEQKYITVGTLLAIFLSTSDEAFIILLSSGRADAAISVLSMVAVKIAVGIVVGYAVDGILKCIGRGRYACNPIPLIPFSARKSLRRYGTSLCCATLRIWARRTVARAEESTTIPVPLRHT